ncbi:MAG: type II secretion system protein [Candidatus Gastranaerophilaceae bacterium]
MPPPRNSKIDRGIRFKGICFGFTLAEVLITLGIIGVVAAMTMPTLINNTNGEQYRAGFKKTLSALNQAVTANFALDNYDFADATINGNANNNISENIIKKRMKVVSYYKQETEQTHMPIDDDKKNGYYVLYPTTFYFNDGSSFSFESSSAENCTKTNLYAGKLESNDDIIYDKSACIGYIDSNGKKGPNKIITCDKSTSYNKLDIFKKGDDDTSSDDCTVSRVNGDIYPVMFYDHTVVPATPAARAVLYGK